MIRWLFFFLGVVAPIRVANLFGVVLLIEEENGVEWKQASPSHKPELWMMC
jgi:hypothetical protein